MMTTLIDLLWLLAHERANELKSATKTNTYVGVQFVHASFLRVLFELPRIPLGDTPLQNV